VIGIVEFPSCDSRACPISSHTLEAAIIEALQAPRAGL
jgi:hypothetical protein